MIFLTTSPATSVSRKSPAVVAVRQLRVVEAEQVQDGGVQVVDADAIDGGLVADLVGLAVVDAALDAAAGEPGREGVRVVVAARLLACSSAAAPPAAGRTRRPRSPASSRAGRAASGRVSRPPMGMSVSPANWRWLPAMSVWPSQLRSFSMPPRVDLHEAHAALDQPPGHQALLGEVRALRVVEAVELAGSAPARVSTSSASGAAICMR